MRITGGKACGRRLKAPAGIRPSQDRLREALFSMLAPKIRGSAFLDLFAGSGAVGIEAWSRGAASVCCVESSRRIAAVLEENASTITGDGCRIARMKVEVFLKADPPHGEFDIIFADPPYGKDGESAWLDRLLGVILKTGVMKQDGVFVMEQRAGGVVRCPAEWNLLRDRSYGDSRLLMFAWDSPRVFAPS